MNARNGAPKIDYPRPTSPGTKRGTRNRRFITNCKSFLPQTDKKKGLTFSPMAKLDKFEAIKDTYMFCRQLCFKALYYQPSRIQELATEERGLFQNLLDLLRENKDITGRRNFSTHKTSLATPSLNMFPAIQILFNSVVCDIHKLRPNDLSGQNITREQRKAITQLQQTPFCMGKTPPLP